MASGKVFEAIVSIAGKIDPSLEKSIKKASKEASGLGGKIKAIGKVGAVAFGAVTTATSAAAVAIGKEALEQYKEYEQLTGGIETLFGAGGQTLDKYAKSVGQTVQESEKEYSNLMKSQEKALANANIAYKTAGMDANEYLQTATSFSASLLQGLGGDTKKAAEVADKAIIDMSDNANKMGTDIELIQNAYNGFAKGNFTMLDNLKLGYGGTKTEMLRLVNDSKVLGKEVKSMDEVSFDQMIEAIHEVQSNIGITGTTAKEASSTIDGSVKSAKAAYNNLLIGIANEDADMDTLATNLTESVIAAAKNIIPRIGIIGKGIVKAAANVLPEIVSGIKQELPNILNVLSEMGPGIIDAIEQCVPGIGPVLQTMFPMVEQTISQLLPMIGGTMQEVISVIGTTIQSIAPAAKTIFSVIMSVLPTVISVFYKIQGVVWGVIEKLMPVITSLLDEVGGLIEELVGLVMPFIEDILDALSPVIDLVVSSIVPILKIIIQIAGQIIRVVMQVLAAVMPVVTQIIQIVAELYTELLSQLMPSLMEIFQAIMPIIEAATQIISAILPVIISILNALMPILKLVANILSTVLGVAIKVVIGYWNMIIGAVNSAINTFKGIITYLKGFVSSWKGIWTSVSGAVSSAFSGLVGVVKGPINTIIGMVNGVINKINGAGFTIPDWIPGVGGKSFKVSVATLPMLATGGHTEGPSIAGEAGTETVISYDPRFRDKNIEYWKQAGQMLGINMTNIEGDGLLARILGIFSKLSNMSMSAQTGTMSDKDEGLTFPDWVPGVGGKSFKVSVATLPMLATGGHTEGPSIAGEAGKETVISYDPRFRDKNIEYWKQAGQMLGINMTNIEGDGLLARMLRIFSKLSNMSMPAQTGTMSDKDEGLTVSDWVPGVGGKSFNVSVATLPMLATGGHTEGPSIAGEAGTETVISYDPRFRDKNIEYWKQAGQMLGINMINVEGDGLLARILGIFSKLSNMSMSAQTGTMLAKDEGFASVLETGNISNSSSYQIDSIQYNPTIIIQGNASEKDVKSALTESKEEFFDKLDEWWDEKTGGGDYEPKFA